MVARIRPLHPIHLLSGALLALAAAVPAGAAGTPDPTFSGDGRANVQVHHIAAAAATAVAVAADGFVTAAGTTALGDDDFVVARLRSSGGLDSTFGTSGTAVVAFDQGGSNDDQLEEVALLAGGKIALLGGAAIGASEGLAVARLLANGQLDTTFPNQGKVVVGHPQWPQGVVSVHAAAVQPDGKYLFAGSCLKCTSNGDLRMNPFVARLHASGKIDKTFGVDGWAVGPWLATEPGLPPDQDDSAGDLAVDSTGRILALVKSYDMTGAVQVVRLLPNGSRDLTWSGDGVKVLSNDPFFFGSALGLDPVSGAVYCVLDGATGWSIPGIYRLLPTGEVDSNFSVNGHLDLADDVSVADLLVDTSGKLVAIGNSDGERFWLARILPNGTPDPSFHFDGFNEIEFDLTAGGADKGFDAALSGTKLVTVGSAMTFLGREAFAILRTD
jgi:uncharacterized delta-60 repeat protein